MIKEAKIAQLINTRILNSCLQGERIYASKIIPAFALEKLFRDVYSNKFFVHMPCKSIHGGVSPSNSN